MTYKQLMIGLAEMSHPSRVRGLKPLLIVYQMVLLGSHPSRVRGLKPQVGTTRLVLGVSRTPRGCVD